MEVVLAKVVLERRIERSVLELRIREIQRPLVAREQRQCLSLIRVVPVPLVLHLVGVVEYLANAHGRAERLAATALLLVLLLFEQLELQHECAINYI